MSTAPRPWPPRRPRPSPLPSGRLPAGRGSPQCQRALDRGYLAVRGMSSLFAARIIVGLLARQTATGVVGHAAEIGVFEGRLLIAMALALAEGERAVAIDPFTWPDPGVGGRVR